MKRSEFELDKGIEGKTLRLHFEELGGAKSHTYFIQLNCDNPILNTGKINRCNFNAYSKIAKNAKFFSKGSGTRLNETDNKIVLFKDLIEFIEEKKVFLLNEETSSKYFGNQGFFLLEFLNDGKYQEIYWQPSSPEDNFWILLENVRDITPEIDSVNQ